MLELLFFIFLFERRGSKFIIIAEKINSPSAEGCAGRAGTKSFGGFQVTMNIKPLFDKVVVESVTVEEKTKSGFFLPSSAQEKPQTCIVVAVGPGGIIDGKEVQMQVKVGDKVLCSKYAGSDFKVDGKEFTIIKQSDILAIVED